VAAITPDRLRRLIDLAHDKDIEQRDHQHQRRHHQTEEQEGDVGRLAAIAGLHQQRARFLLADPFVEIELLDNLRHVLLGRLAQRDLFAARHPLAFALAHLLAFERDRLHALAERVGRKQRHRQREHGGDGGDGGEHHRGVAGTEVVDQKIDHDTRRASFRNRS
jgi:hypothetical protein